MPRDHDHEWIHDEEVIGRPLDGRFVLVGLVLLVISVIVAIVVANPTIRIESGIGFAASLFLMTRRKHFSN